MIEILLERFLIYNPKSQKDKTRFKDKKINTYLYLLDKNSFIKIEWDWDKGLINEIKTKLKDVLKEHFQSYHNDIYKYCSHIKNNDDELWKNEPNKIIKLILDKLENIQDCPDYITDVFIEINEDEDYDNITEDNLNDKLSEKLERYLKRYLNSSFIEI